VRVANRILKLERTVDVNGASVIYRFQRAVDQAAYRAGTTLAAVSAEAAVLDRIVEDVHESFTRQLNQPDLENLTRELERIVSAAG
jgi:hypothetical protein